MSRDKNIKQYLKQTHHRGTISLPHFHHLRGWSCPPFCTGLIKFVILILIVLNFLSSTLSLDLNLKASIGGGLTPTPSNQTNVSTFPTSNHTNVGGGFALDSELVSQSPTLSNPNGLQIQSTIPTASPAPTTTGTIPGFLTPCPIPSYGFISGARETNLVPSTFPRCPITKDQEITYTQSTERLAEIETRLISPKNTLVEVDSFVDPSTNKPKVETACTSHSFLKQKILSEFLKLYPKSNTWQQWYEYLNNYQSTENNLIILEQTSQMDRLSKSFDIDPTKVDCELISGLDKATKLSKLERNSWEGSIATTLPLGLSLKAVDLQPDQDRFSECTILSQNPIKNRRLGTCSDGIYTIESRVADSAGNASNWKIEKVERDTARPDKPAINALVVGDKRNQ
jgi:hypothetical protein